MNNNHKKNQILLFAVLLVVVTAIQCVAFFSIAAQKKENKKQDAMIYGQGLANAISMILDKSVHSTESLKEFYSIYGDDVLSDFDAIADSVYKNNTSIGSMYIAPKAVIQAAYPKEVTESTIGFAMLDDPEQGARAQLAIDTRQTTVAGPHYLVEGGKGLIIRNPLFDGDEFVGFTIVVIDWDMFVDEVLSSATGSLDRYKFAVWKQEFDETAVADQDGYIFRNTDDEISKEVDIEINVPNDTWHLVVEPVDGWAVAKEMRWQIGIAAIAGALLIALCMILVNGEYKKRIYNEALREHEEREKHTAQLAAALEQAENANKAKTAFLNNMSHDIRTPMNAILGFTALMENELEQPDKLKDHLNKVKYSGEYLLDLINNVLEVARIDSGKEVVDEDFVDLMDPKCSVAPLLENELQKKKIVFTNHMDIQHRYVLTDIAKIREITMNLMSNAIKYTPEGGSIHLEFVEVPSDKEGYATYVNTITDTGIGMSAEFQKHLFDSFTRERNTTESKVAGTGLGMSIVKKLVDLMGGTVEVESEPGKGSCFKVTLNHLIVENPEDYLAKQIEDEAIRDKVLIGKRILLAEDNELNAEISTAILEEAGLMVEHARDGVECVEMLANSERGYYDLVLMDIQMPNLDGYGAAKRIRALEDENKANIPIIALTANAFEEDKMNALEAGMNNHLGKPIDVAEFMRMLALYIE